MPIVAFLWLGLAESATAQILCPPERIVAASFGDTVEVEHHNATHNCCSDLLVEIVVTGSFLDFFENETGEICRCLCCSHPSYAAYGLATGRYTVRVWNGDGSILHGTTEVVVNEGSTGPVGISKIESGKCAGASHAIESVTWGRVRTRYR